MTAPLEPTVAAQLTRDAVDETIEAISRIKIEMNAAFNGLLDRLYEVQRACERFGAGGEP